MLKDLYGNIMTNTSGEVLKSPDLPVIEFDHNQSVFPPIQGMASPVFQLSSKPGTNNTVNFDYGDGSAIASYNFTTNTSIPTYTYPAGAAKRTVKMWFSNPNNIYSITISRQRLIGKFPENLLFYRFSSAVSISSVYFEEFPTGLGGGYFQTLNLNSITPNSISFIPTWITNSRIFQLALSGLNLSNKLNNNLDKIIKIKGITNLSLGSCSINTSSIPSNFKDISTLRTLAFAANPVQNISQEINDMKQITHLSFGYRHQVNWTNGMGNGALTSWGVGIGGMNLNQLSIVFAASGQLLPLTPPTGIELCPALKTIDYRSAYKGNQTRMDTLVTNFYNIVVAKAIISNSSTIEGLLRKVNWLISWVNFYAGANDRPSGIFQAPLVGFNLGVDNGKPESPMEMLYVLCKNYRWTVEVMNETLTDIQTLS